MAGVRTVKALRRKGFDGEIVLIGEENELPYERPPLSKQFLTSEDQIEPKQLEPQCFYDGIDLRLGRRAVSLNRRERSITLDDESVVRADDVVIATGSVARTLPALEGVAGVTPLRTVADARRIRDAFAKSPRVVVVGGGFIGCEVAASARQRELDVTIVEALHAPIIRGLGALVGDTIAAMHRENGVTVHLDSTVASFEADHRIRAITLTDGTRLEADLLVVGIGANPRTDWLDHSGLEVRNGVVCDEHCRAQGGGGHVWAAGEVACWPSRRFGESLRIEHWTNSAEQGNALAASLLDGDAARPYDPVPYIWSDQYGQRFQIVGRVSAHDQTMLMHGSLRQRQFAVGYWRDGRLRGVAARDMPEMVAEAREQLGNRSPELTLV